MVALHNGFTGRTRTTALRLVIRDFLDRGALVPGVQSRLADRWGVTRQRLSRLVAEERKVTAGPQWRTLGCETVSKRIARTG